MTTLALTEKPVRIRKDGLPYGSPLPAKEVRIRQDGLPYGTKDYRIVWPGASPWPFATHCASGLNPNHCDAPPPMWTHPQSGEEWCSRCYPQPEHLKDVTSVDDQ